jgi:RNA polymerase sigma factor (sigma-70 family)
MKDEEAEAMMWERYRKGDQQARDELILYHLPLVRLLVSRISRNTGWASREDLMEEGVIGLVRAVERFDPNRGVKFQAFARRYIMGAVYDSPEMTRMVPRRQDENLRKVRLAHDELLKSLNRKPTLEEVAQKSRLTTTQVKNALDAGAIAFPSEHLSLEVEGSREGFERLQDLFESGKLSNVSGVEIRDIRWDATHPDYVRTLLVKEALAKLSEREALILTDSYWSGRSDQEISEQLGLSETALTRIRQRAIRKLRSLMKETRE